MDQGTSGWTIGSRDRAGEWDLVIGNSGTVNWAGELEIRLKKEIMAKHSTV